MRSFRPLLLVSCLAVTLLPVPSAVADYPCSCNGDPCDPDQQCPPLAPDPVFVSRDRRVPVERSERPSEVAPPRVEAPSIERAEEKLEAGAAAEGSGPGGEAAAIRFEEVEECLAHFRKGLWRSVTRELAELLLFEQLDRLEAARAAAQAAAEHQALQAQRTESLEYLELVLRDPGEEFRRRMAEAHRLALQDREPEALGLMTPYVGLSEEDEFCSPALVMGAWLHMRQHQYRPALDLLGRARVSEKMLELTTRAQFATNQVPEAVESFKLLRALYPSSPLTGRLDAMISRFAKSGLIDPALLR